MNRAKLNRNQRFSRICATMAAIGVLGLASVAYAGATSWSYANYDNGSYVPKAGTFTEGTYGGYQYWSRAAFAFDSNNVAKIVDYNNGGDNPGTACDNAKAYVTIDMTAVPDNSWDLELSAVEIYTNLPNPKLDLEADGGVDNEESEIAVLGAVSSSSYYMRTYWDDYRDGGASDGGKIQVQFAMSKLGWSDYNNCTQASVVQIINAYGNTFGSL